MLRKIIYFCIGLCLFSVNNSYCTSQEVDIYRELKTLKQQPNFVVDKQYLELLGQLKIIADQDNFKAQNHYISAVRHLKWNPDILVSDSMPSDPDLQRINKWSNLESIRNSVLSNMAKYRDNLIQKYEEDIKKSDSESESDVYKTKFNLSKLLLVSNADDPGNKRKLKFLEIKKELQNTPEAERINNWYEKYKKNFNK